jgi:hypothetical protein
MFAARSAERPRSARTPVAITGQRPSPRCWPEAASSTSQCRPNRHYTSRRSSCGIHINCAKCHKHPSAVAEAKKKQGPRCCNTPMGLNHLLSDSQSERMVFFIAVIVPMRGLTCKDQSNSPQGGCKGLAITKCPEPLLRDYLFLTISAKALEHIDQLTTSATSG